jgi:hypothetical protein
VCELLGGQQLLAGQTVHVQHPPLVTKQHLQDIANNPDVTSAATPRRLQVDCLYSQATSGGCYTCLLWPGEHAC